MQNFAGIMEVQEVREKRNQRVSCRVKKKNYNELSIKFHAIDAGGRELWLKIQNCVENLVQDYLFGCICLKYVDE